MPDGIYVYIGVGIGYGVSGQFTAGTSMTNRPVSVSIQGTSNILPGNFGPYNSGSASISAYDIPKLLSNELEFDDISWEAGYGISKDAWAVSAEFGSTWRIFKY